MPTKAEVIEQIKTVIDPHLGSDVYTLGLIRSIEIEGNEVQVTFVPTSPFCPMGIQLAQAIKDAVGKIEGVKPIVTVQGHIQEKAINEALNG
ncbi:MAG: metal-sulfur cluster assembly factor [Thermoplasmata archaeon]|nr:metal-sulfur cluster assembly factor [Thermoplasmata archaeon]